MFHVIHSNRYFIPHLSRVLRRPVVKTEFNTPLKGAGFIWTLVFLFASSLVLMFWIQSYLLEVEKSVFEDQAYLRSGWTTYRSQDLQIAVRYPKSWQIEIDPQDGHTFSLQNPGDFGENISFSRTDPKYESIIRSSLDTISEKSVLIDGNSAQWLTGNPDDQATSNVILVNHDSNLYYFAGSAKNFEKIIKSVKFLTNE